MLFPVIVKKLKTMEVSILIIRQERPEDYDTVYHVVKEAFENAEYTDGIEQNCIWRSPAAAGAVVNGSGAVTAAAV